MEKDRKHYAVIAIITAALILAAAFVLLLKTDNPLRPRLRHALFEISCSLAPGKNDGFAYAMDEILCIGDSLTEGAYFGKDYKGESIEQNYPYYLGRMLNASVENAGVGGYSASDWYEEESDGYDYSDYDTVLIWLGTNNGLTDTLDEDVEPYNDYEDFAESETGYYCMIIEKIREENPDCLIALMNVYASKGDVELTNEVIEDIACRYDLHVIDTSALGMENTQYHAGLRNPHLGKAGNIAAAQLVIRDMGNFLAEYPLRCEFSVDEDY